MAKLIYMTPSSIDGYIADETGDPSWAAPDEEGFAFITDLLRPIGTYLYGRRIYQTMSVWETPEVIPNRTPAMLEFSRIWKQADKIVYSRSLETVRTPKTRLNREFDTQAIADLKAQLPHDLSVSGPTLAAQALCAGAVDECHLFMAPVLLGGGRRVLPGGLSAKLELVDERRFANGAVYLRYRFRR
ncbi:MAG: dihydrofolate reductase family protein [Acidobacteriota bacterium]|nr:dihydrofolate reductase family protein [Acidobacteriota bacterium]